MSWRGHPGPHGLPVPAHREWSRSILERPAPTDPAAVVDRAVDTTSGPALPVAPDITLFHLIPVPDEGTFVGNELGTIRKNMQRHAVIKNPR